MVKHSLTALLLLLAASAVAQVETSVQLGVLGSTIAIPVPPRELRNQDLAPVSKLGYYGQLEVHQRLRRIRIGGILRFSTEGAEASTLWPEVRTTHLALGPTFSYGLTKVIDVRLGLLASYLTSERHDGAFLPADQPTGPTLDGRIQFGLRGHFNRFGVEMVVERGLTNNGGSVLIPASLDVEYRPAYHMAAVRFGIIYQLFWQKTDAAILN